jgi:primosomal protein N' (replication factor Y)
LSLAAVAVGRPVRGEFTYLVPPELEGRLVAGQRIEVPFGRGKALGFYLGPAQPPPGAPELKPILRVLEEEPSVAQDVLQLLRFAADHYRYPLGEAIRSALPPGLADAREEKEAGPKVERFAVAAEGAEAQALPRAPAQHATLSYLLAVGGRAPIDELALAIPGARDSLKRLVEKGLARIEEREVIPGEAVGLAGARPAQLTREQARALETISESIAAGGFAPFLLHGVTGSGKTEIYLRSVELARARGKGALVLVPEIALTPQLVGRFKARFGADVAVLHSALRDKERLRHFQKLKRGEVQIAVGVRSAIFAPVHELGIVIVDEEHEPSFKQEEKLRYHARDLAVVRAKQTGATVVLGSATPSLESLHNARAGRYRLITLENRVDDRPLPGVELIDLRELRPKFGLPDTEPPILSAPLIDAIDTTLARGQQAILFLNRRGHSTFLLCATCGQSVRCELCDVSLTLHLKQKRLVCHYCGTAKPIPQACPACAGPLLPLGVGTERVEAEVADRFPKARVARLDRDAASSAEKLTDLLASFARREIDLLVGTQMVAKGHDFPGVTLVCVVLADTGLSLPDFRAAERTFQLLTQVAGRAGRGQDPGRVLVQTYHPDAEPVRRVIAHDFNGFAEQELEWRKGLAYPPFSRMAAVRIEAIDPGTAERIAKNVARAAVRHLPPPELGVRMLGPAPAPIARLQGKSRWQLLLKGPTHASLAGPLLAIERAAEDRPASAKVVIDVDPGAML